MRIYSPCEDSVSSAYSQLQRAHSIPVDLQSIADITNKVNNFPEFFDFAARYFLDGFESRESFGSSMPSTVSFRTLISQNLNSFNRIW